MEYIQKYYWNISIIRNYSIFLEKLQIQAMQFDELNNRLFALAKKGTQDEYFAIGRSSGFRSRRKSKPGNLDNSIKKGLLKEQVSPPARKAIKDLKNLQFTLFD
jgi:hypothetical protein